jgi:hypothetical protein
MSLKGDSLYAFAEDGGYYMFDLDVNKKLIKFKGKVSMYD